MNALIEELKNRGCDIEGAMSRFLNDEAFYLRCYKIVMEDKNFDKLKTSLENGEVTNAFEAVHSLKGVVANMGISPMYDIIVEMVDPLRQGSAEGLMPKCEQLLEMKDSFSKLMDIDS